MVGYLGLYVYSWFNVYSLFAPYALAVAGGSGSLLFYLSFFMFRFFVKTETRLTNFVGSTVSFCSTTEALLEAANSSKRLDLDKSAEIWLMPITLSGKLTSRVLGAWTVKQAQSEDDCQDEAAIQDTVSLKAGFVALSVASPAATTTSL
ncbi:hypothetical protein JG687_00019702 [Phytophthora cactorum]|uniref:Uncharacterized protein n=1 Tax=Phytophthora cactorum TaxID=29920 RepID=A0A8T1TIT8_9STRA|nr:hypothetical protein GQ600_3913 [Phytophthora cactorum]KAG6941361.1 hypothetical protein JG687_00019702 [Phytophthora cactorum]